MEQVPGPNRALLDSNHSHFLLVDDGTEGKYGVEIDLRSRFEEAVMKEKTDSRSAAGMSQLRQRQKRQLNQNELLSDVVINFIANNLSLVGDFLYSLHLPVPADSITNLTVP